MLISNHNSGSVVLPKNFLSLTALQYFSAIYAICLITSLNTTFIPAISNLNLISFVYDQSNVTKDIFKKSIDLGCQTFIISDDAFDIFLQDFYEVHDDSIQVFHNKQVVVYSMNENKGGEFINRGVLTHPSIDGD